MVLWIKVYAWINEQGAVLLQLRSSFFSTKYTSLGPKLSLKAFVKQYPDTKVVIQ